MFAREGANVFLAGRTVATLEAVAAEITAAGGTVETAEVDALDEQAVEEHASDVARRAGTIDVSFNAISLGDVQGTPLLEMPLADFSRPIRVGTTTHLLTARAAARHMVMFAQPVLVYEAEADALRRAYERALGRGVTPPSTRAIF